MFLFQEKLKIWLLLGSKFMPFQFQKRIVTAELLCHWRRNQQTLGNARTFPGNAFGLLRLPQSLLPPSFVIIISTLMIFPCSVLHNLFLHCAINIMCCKTPPLVANYSSTSLTFIHTFQAITPNKSHSKRLFLFFNSFTLLTAISTTHDQITY